MPRTEDIVGMTRAVAMWLGGSSAEEDAKMRAFLHIFHPERRRTRRRRKSRLARRGGGSK